MCCYEYRPMHAAMAWQQLAAAAVDLQQAV